MITPSKKFFDRCWSSEEKSFFRKKAGWDSTRQSQSGRSMSRKEKRMPKRPAEVAVSQRASFFSRPRLQNINEEERLEKHGYFVLRCESARGTDGQTDISCLFWSFSTDLNFVLGLGIARAKIFPPSFFPLKKQKMLPRVSLFISFSPSLFLSADLFCVLMRERPKLTHSSWEKED